MTNTNAKSNLELILEAVESTPAKTSKNGAGSSEFTTALLEVINGIGKPLAINQMVAALQAIGMSDMTNKKVCDRVWLLAKRGQVAKLGNGMYGPIVEEVE